MNLPQDKMSILAIGAHPDDIEIGCAGTLIKYSRAGHRVYLLVMTSGGLGGEDEVRRQEQAVSKGILGAEELYWGGYRDTEISVDVPTISRVEEVLKRVSPDFIFVNFTDDTHQDHRNLAQITVTASRYTRNVLFYETPTTQNFSPNVYVDISECLEDKIKSLQAHNSQVLKTNIEGLSIVEVARSSANFRGVQARVKFAEAFQSLRLFINI
ncbi:PIG-L family deacetylase [candidate division KSB1 bacterium]|nr:PIG-L family deacetylase [candidate division KSB1 bacterium]